MADQHRDHDLGPVVAFADGELSGADRDVVAAQVVSCDDCAGLVADLVALTVADRSMTTPARPRDFRLTEADAARLATMSVEPRGIASRPDGEMTTLPSSLPDHPNHDPLLIAAMVDGTLDGPDQARTASWLTGCSACAGLHDDLLAIAAANRALPTPPRSVDYRLTPEAAQRARGSGLRGLLARFGSARDGFSRPLAAGLTTLGLAGLILTSGSSVLMGSASSGADQVLSTVGAALPDQNSKTGDQRAVTQATDMPGVFTGQGESAGSAVASAAPAAAAAPLASMAAPAPDDQAAMEMTDGAGLADGDPSLEAPDAALPERQEDAGTSTVTGPTNGPPAASVISLVLLLIGLGLFAGRWLARRQTPA